MKNLFTTSLWVVAGLSSFVQVGEGSMDWYGCEINFIQAAAHERRGDAAGGGGLADLLGVLGGQPAGTHGEKGAKGAAQTVTQVVTVTRAAAKPTGAVGGGNNGTCAAVKTVTVTEQVAAGSGYASYSTLFLNDVLTRIVLSNYPFLRRRCLELVLLQLSPLPLYLKWSLN